MKRLIYIFCLIPVCFANGQNTVDESFVIRKNRSLELPVADRNYSFKLQKSNPSNFIQPLQLSFDSIQQPDIIESEITPLNAQIRNFNTNTNHQITNHLVWLSAGNRINTEAGYQYINPVDQKRRIYLLANHRSLAIGPTQNNSSAHNHQKIRFDLFQPFKKNGLKWMSTINRSHFNYYGVTDSLYDDPSTINSIESANLWRLSNQIAFNKPQGPLYWNISAGHKITNSESLKGASEQWFNGVFKSKYSFNQDLRFSFNSELDYIQTAPARVDDSRLINQNSISGTKSFERLQFSLGANLVFHTKDSLYSNIESTEDPKNSQWEFLPSAILTYNFSADQTFSLGLKSGVNPNTYYQRSFENIFLNYLSMDFRTEIVKSHWFINYEHKLGDDHHLRMSANYSSTENKSFFINNNLDTASLFIRNERAFSLAYNDEDVGHFFADIAFHGEISNRLKYFLSLQTHQYYLNSLAEAYHLPTFISQLNTSFKASDKLLISSDLIINTGIIYSGIEESGSIINWSLNGDYTLNNKLSATIRFNNILNQSNMRYYLYPTSPFLISIGAQFRF